MRASLPSRRLEALVCAAMLGGILAYLVSYFPPALLLERTITTGGDTASHFLTARELRDALLAEGRLHAWMPGNLAGYPTFQLYFPLPFLLIVGLGTAVGLEIGFKLVTVLGTLLLPLCAFASFRQLGFRHPVPALAAGLTLPFLMLEANSVWGGNIPSTLAGEFCYSLGLALTLLFVGTSYRGLVEGRRLVPNALLLAAIALSHAYALLVAGAVSAAYLLVLPDLRRCMAYLARLYVLTFALISFWILPLLAYAPFTSPYRDIWAIESWRRVLPPVLWPFAATALLFGAYRAARRLRAPGGRGALARNVAALWSLIWVAALLYYLAPHLGAVDIRFLPFLQLGTTLLAAVPLGRLARRAPRLWLLPLLFGAATALWAEAHVGYIPHWIDWNYTGFESKPLWPAFAEVNRRLAGDATDPRVVFEHAPQHNAAGSIRAFESLPLFSGRSTLEGLYIQSSINTPFIFYLQSEYSGVASCPLPEYHCGRLDLARAAEHLRQFNVGDIVAVTEPVKSALKRSPDFSLASAVGPYEIHRVRGNADRYVVPLAWEPVLLETDDWKRDVYRWFLRPGTAERVLVHRDDPDAVDLERFGSPSPGLPGVFPLRPLGGGVELQEEILDNEIRIRTSRPGHPLLVRISYHPRWRLADGGRVYLASPGFMLIYPRSSEARLVFGPTPLTRSANMISLTAALILLAGPARRQPRSKRVAAGPSPGGVSQPLARLEGWLERRRPVVVLGAPLLLLLSVGLLAAHRSGSEAPQLYERGMEAYRADDFATAAAAFEAAMSADSLSSAALHASFYRALTAYRSESWQQAIDLFTAMRESYPDSIYRAEAEYHIGLCQRNLGRWPEARASFELVRQSFPETPWARHAGQRLEESWALTRLSATPDGDPDRITASPSRS